MQPPFRRTLVLEKCTKSPNTIPLPRPPSPRHLRRHRRCRRRRGSLHISGADRTRTTRHTWTVLDQILPLPSGLGAADLTPLMSSVGERLRHSAFRAHHDTGNFTEDEQLCTNARLIGRSVWNTYWALIIPSRSLLSDPAEGLDRFIHGALQPDGTRDGHGITDIRLYFQTYSYSGE